MKDLTPNLKNMSSRLRHLQMIMNFLNKLLKDNSEVDKLKKIYMNMVNIFNAWKEQNLVDKGLKSYADNLISEGNAIADEELNLLTEEDLITLDNHLSSKGDFNDTFKLSRTNTNFGSMLNKRDSDLDEVAMLKSKSNNFEFTDLRKGKSK